MRGSVLEKDSVADWWMRALDVGGFELWRCVGWSVCVYVSACLGWLAGEAVEDAGEAVEAGVEEKAGRHTHTHTRTQIY